MSHTPAPPTPGLELMDAPDETGALPLGGALDLRPGAPPESWFRLRGKASVRNVAAATLTPVLPPTSHATGAAAVIAPGGGFFIGALENEAWPLATRLAAQGVAAFVLKYRLLETPADLEVFREALVRRFAEAAADPSGSRRIETPAAAVEDARAAVRLVRARAGDWGVDPSRVGYVGASAGAMVGLELVRPERDDAQPDFLACLYPSMERRPTPADAPPLFVAMASDDPLFGRQGYGLAEGWREATGGVELHVYERGGHGFGMGAQGTTSPAWVDALCGWLTVHGWAGPAR